MTAPILPPLTSGYPAVCEVFEPTAEELAEARAALADDGDEDDDRDDALDEPALGAVTPPEPVEQIEPAAAWGATLYRNVKATRGGTPISWGLYRHLANTPVVIDDLDLVEMLGESSTQTKLEIGYVCLHSAAGYRNALHVRGSSGFQIDLEGCDRETTDAELEALRYVDLIHPSISHWIKLAVGEFRVRATIRTSRWMTEDERAWIFDRWIAVKAPHADRAMRSSVQGSVIPAVAPMHRAEWWVIETGAVMPVDDILAEIGEPPKGYTKQSGATLGVPVDRVPVHPMPMAGRVSMLRRALAHIGKCPARSDTTGGTLRGAHGFPWMQSIAREAVNRGVVWSEALAIAAELADPSWHAREVAEGFVGAWKALDRSSIWESLLAPGDTPIAASSLPCDVPDRIATFAGGMLFVKAGMGSGKTEGAARLCLANPTWRVLFVTSRQRSAKEAARRAGLAFYQNASPSSTRVAVCINSLAKFALDAKGKLRQWDLVIVDEMPEVIASIFKLCRQPPQQTLQLLLDTFRGAAQVGGRAIALSADLREWHVGMVAYETVCETIDAPEVLLRHAYVMTCAETEVAAWDALVELHAAREAGGAERKIVLQATSKATLDRFARKIEQELPLLRTFKLTRHTDPEAVGDFDAVVREHDVLLMNTAGGSALSCTHPVWRQFVILDNNSIGGQAIGQLIGRIRVLADDGMLIVGERVQRGTVLTIERGKVVAEIEGHALGGAWGDLGFTNAAGEFRWYYPPAKDALVNLTIDARAQRIDPTFAAEAERRGWSVEHVRYDDPTTDVAAFAAHMRQLKKEIRDEQIAAIVKAADMSPAEYRALAAGQYMRTPTMEATISRHLIQREILGDVEEPMPTDWREQRAWSCRASATRSDVDPDLARRWQDGAYAGMMRRWCLLRSVTVDPAVGFVATDIDEPEREQHDACRASGEGFEARLLDRLVRECFGIAPGDAIGTRSVPVGRPRKDGSHKHWRTVPDGTPIDLLRERVLAFYREHHAALDAAGWGDAAAPTRETAIGWLGDRLRGRVAVRLTRRGKGADRTYSPAWPPEGHWRATWARMEARAAVWAASGRPAVQAAVDARAALQCHTSSGAEKGPTKTKI